MRFRGFRSGRTSVSWKYRAVFARLNASGFLACTFLDTSDFLSYNQANRESRSFRTLSCLLLLKCFSKTRAYGADCPVSGISLGRRTSYDEYIVMLHNASPECGLPGQYMPFSVLSCSTRVFHPLHLQDGHEFQNVPLDRPRHRRICNS